MQFLIKIVEFFWPTLWPQKAEDIRAEAADRADTISDISTQSWAVETDTALSEARRVTDAEADRRKSTDSKAAAYLSVTGGLTTILMSFTPAILTSKYQISLRICCAILLLAAISYLSAGGIWAFTTLRVTETVRVDVFEILARWGTRTPKTGLIKDFLQAARLNHDIVNRKVTRLKMTEAFLVRAFATVALLVVVQLLWPAGSYIFRLFNPPSAHSQKLNSGSNNYPKTGPTPQRVNVHTTPSSSAQKIPGSAAAH